MIRGDRANCRLDFGISLRGLRNFLACLVGKRPRETPCNGSRVVRAVRVEKVLACPLDRVNCRVNICVSLRAFRNFARGGGGGVLPHISYIGMCLPYIG